MSNYYVYKITNPINNKVYIGISKSLENRWNNGEGYKYNKLFYKDIKLHGWDNFKKEILFESTSLDYIYKKEAEIINFYNSTNSEIGYNIRSSFKSNNHCQGVDNSNSNYEFIFKNKELIYSGFSQNNSKFRESIGMNNQQYLEICNNKRRYKISDKKKIEYLNSIKIIKFKYKKVIIDLEEDDFINYINTIKLNL